MDEDTQKKRLLENVKNYRKTDVYKRQRDSFVYDMPNWAEWLYERVKKKRGEINAGEALFLFCFLLEDSHLKIYLEYLRANGNIDHKYNAENSLEILSQIISKENIGQVYKEPQPEQAAPEPQQKQTKPTRRKGRPKSTFKDCMVNDEDGIRLKKIHSVMKGRIGKGAALVMLACIKKGWLIRPTYAQVKNEFGDIGSSTGYNNYLDEKRFTKDEIDGAINSLN